MPLVLASQSAVRARLLVAAGVPFEAVAAHIDEALVKESLLAEKIPPRDIADYLAELKAVRVSMSRPGSLVIGADQILVFDREVISKSETLAEARVLLRRLAGQRHELIAALCLAKDGVVIWRHVDRVDLQMRKCSDAFLDAYLESQGEAVLDSVGCYHLEGQGAQLFSRISGDYFAVLGLPLLPLLDRLRDFGVLPK